LKFSKIASANTSNNNNNNNNSNRKSGESRTLHLKISGIRRGSHRPPAVVSPYLISRVDNARYKIGLQQWHFWNYKWDRLYYIIFFVVTVGVRPSGQLWIAVIRL